MRQSFIWVIAALAASVTAAPLLAPHSPSQQFTDFVHAPPMIPRLIGPDGGLRAPFVYPLRLESRLERRYTEERTRPVPIASSAEAPGGPLGTDALGRDVLPRLLFGARVSLGVAMVSAAGALTIGLLVGSLAGVGGRLVDEGVMRATEFVVALPAIYVVLALRAALPLSLSPPVVFWTMVSVFALVGWPLAARGVRIIVLRESGSEYAEAARSVGASGTRLLLHHLLPATSGFLLGQATLLIPAFILAEATLSYIGLGFGEPTPSCGVMLQEAGRGPILAEAPWLIAPAAAIVVVVFSVNSVASRAQAVPFRRTDPR